MKADSIFDRLNPSQRRATEHFCGPMLVVAGAGSGKTRVLTHRIAHLILVCGVDPEEILAVTFTNKAAREMKERLETLLADCVAIAECGAPLDELPPAERTRLKSAAYRQHLKPLWIGTFHSICARILRFDIEKYQDEKGRKWQKNFSILDEGDVHDLVKGIVLGQMNLDKKKFEPRSIRYAISNAKNRGLTAEAFAQEQPNYRGRIIAEVYDRYQTALAANNALDFDELIWIPVRLFQQNESLLGYWHQRFRHLLVDEYQDTNRIQYDLLRLLATNGENPASYKNWKNRSIFVVGDVDQAIYSFRMADFRILLEFQEDFGDRLPDDATQTTIKLEENYRSTESILQAANHLIENNTQRIEKVLRATRGEGEPICIFKATDETEEAEFVANRISLMVKKYPDRFQLGDFAVLYRTNAQSRAIEEAMVRSNILYTIVGSFRFYDRKEVKDVIAYLRLLLNPSDTVSLLRVINVPKRGIGKTTIEKLLNAAQELNVPLWEVIREEESVQTLAGSRAKAILRFVTLVQRWQEERDRLPPSEIVEGIIRESGYQAELQAQGTDEAIGRLENVREIVSAAKQFESEEEEGATLAMFLSRTALSSDLDGLEEKKSKATLMTLHAAKGLEFSVVFLVGMEQGLLPHSRSLDEPEALEEERRLCYVGITRAKEKLYLTHAKSRYLWGQKQPTIASFFLKELPRELLSAGRRTGGETAPRSRSKKTQDKRSQSAASDWAVGDRLYCEKRGPGEVTHVFGSGDKTTIAVKFSSCKLILDAKKMAALQRVDAT